MFRIAARVKMLCIAINFQFHSNPTYVWYYTHSHIWTRRRCDSVHSTPHHNQPGQCELRFNFAFDSFKQTVNGTHPNCLTCRLPNTCNAKMIIFFGFHRFICFWNFIALSHSGVCDNPSSISIFSIFSMKTETSNEIEVNTSHGGLDSISSCCVTHMWSTLD